MTTQDDETQGAILELISFEIGGQEFCIDIRTVREIRNFEQHARDSRRPAS